MGKFTLKLERDGERAGVLGVSGTLNEDLRILVLALFLLTLFLPCDRDLLLQGALPSLVVFPTSCLLPASSSPPLSGIEQGGSSGYCFQDKQISLLASNAATPLDFFFPLS